MKQTHLVRALLLSGALLATVAGCDIDKALQVEPAGLIPSVELENPANAALLVQGAAADFDCAFNSFVIVGALISQEFVDALQTADRWPYNQRTVLPNQSRYSTNSCTGLGIYKPLQSARVSANNIRRLMEGWTDVQVPNRQLLIATAATYEAWAHLFIGESFQETVFSTIDGETVNFGTIISRADALDSAIVRFTQAITTATTVGASADNVRNFALAGRARAYLDRAYVADPANPDATNLANARADAAAVSAGFVWNVTASSTTGRRDNQVYDQSDSVVTQQSSSVGPYYRGIGRQTGTTTGDPRVPVMNMNRTSNGTAVPQWAQLKYKSVSAPIPVTSATEMQLIIAEVDARSVATRANALTIIAAFRAAGAQPPYTGVTLAQDLAEIQDQRRRALWLTGTYYADVIRYDILLSPAQGTTTPWGQQYGPAEGRSQLLPLPDVERQNNPNLR